MNAFSLKISSPNGDVFSGDAEKIVLRGAEGDLAILANHAPFITSVVPCDCRIYISEEDVKTGRIEGGLLCVENNSVTLLSSSFVWI